MERRVSQETMPAREIQLTTYSTPHPIIPIPKGPKNRSRRHRNQRNPDLSHPARRSLLWDRSSRTFRHPILNQGQGQTRCQPAAAPKIPYKGALAAPVVLSLEGHPCRFRPWDRYSMDRFSSTVPRTSSERVEAIPRGWPKGLNRTSIQTFHHQSLSSPYFSRALVTRATKFFASTGARTLASLSK